LVIKLNIKDLSHFSTSTYFLQYKLRLRKVIIFFGVLNGKILRQIKDKTNFKIYNKLYYRFL